MESEKMLIGMRVVNLGYPTTTRVITENPSAEVCNIKQPQDKLGKEQERAISQPRFPEVLTNYTPQKAYALHFAELLCKNGGNVRKSFSCTLAGE
jgi:hypothetical protein